MSVRASLKFSLSASFSVARRQGCSLISEDTLFVRTSHIQALQCRSGAHYDDEVHRMLQYCDLQATMRDGVQLATQMRKRD